MRRGFTLVELMVACVLLSMLMTALTLVFNQSAVAWRTGMAGVVNLQGTRREMGRVNEDRDAFLPHVESKNDLKWRVVSVFDGTGALRTDRAVETGAPMGFSFADAEKGNKIGLTGRGVGQSSSLFIIGVRSAGPDRKFDTDDDITTWPEVD